MKWYNYFSCIQFWELDALFPHQFTHSDTHLACNPFWDMTSRYWYWIYTHQAANSELTSFILAFSCKFVLWLIWLVLFTGSWVIRTHVFWIERNNKLCCTWPSCYPISQDAFYGSSSIREFPNWNGEPREWRLCWIYRKYIASISAPHFCNTGLLGTSPLLVSPALSFSLEFFWLKQLIHACTELVLNHSHLWFPWNFFGMSHLKVK